MTTPTTPAPRRLTAQQRSGVVVALRGLARYDHDDLSIGSDAADTIEADGVELARLQAENERLAAALRELVTPLLANLKDCGDPNTECPLQDAHKDWHPVQQARAALARYDAGRKGT